MQVSCVLDTGNNINATY